MIIYYGNQNNAINVTEICHERLKKDNVITIPCGDVKRSTYFGDPLVGILKTIFVDLNGAITAYHANYTITIECNTMEITAEPDAWIKLLKLHSTLKLNHGSLMDEFPEQKMAVNYLKGNEKVLEIGGNIGRNSCVISRLLSHSDFVTLECDTMIAEQLRENRDLNELTFHIENAALSKRKLIQKGWDTIPSDTLLPEYTWVNTLSWDELNQKYNIPFDTLVLDCEGAFYYILLDMPEILDNIQLILMENDYREYSHKLEVDAILLERGFRVHYAEAGGWGPCYSHFFEVWKR